MEQLGRYVEVRAQARNVRRSPRKIRLIADAVRGRKVDEALALLRFIPNYAARDVEKVIKSAAANAENNYDLDIDTLVVYRIEVDEAVTMKRFKPGAHGRVKPRLKRSSHITAIVR
jgi:large subunit ribosomal protein L22